MPAEASIIRTFVGVPLSADCQRASDELLCALRGPGGPLREARVACPRAENRHLTLKFLGDTRVDRIDELRVALARIPFHSFELAFAGAGYFPDLKRPRVFWAGICRGGEQLAALAKEVNLALSSLGFMPEKRPFQAHLTLCRVREPGKTDWGAAVRVAEGHFWPSMQVERFVLWQSVLGAGGAVYTPLGEFGAK